MSNHLNKLVAEFNRYFTSSNGVDVPERVSVSRDEWRQLHAALHAYGHATQPAEVTDEQIIAIKKATKAADPTQQWGDTLAFARAILALRPMQVPMTEEQIRSMCKQGWVFETVKQWVRIIEANHGITAQAKKE